MKIVLQICEYIYPGCNYYETCRPIEEGAGGVFCCSSTCEGEPLTWKDNKLICDLGSSYNFRICSCENTGKHFHCTGNNCQNIVELYSDHDHDMECDLCRSCRLIAERTALRCKLG